MPFMPVSAVKWWLSEVEVGGLQGVARCMVCQHAMSIPHVTCFGSPRLCETSMDLQYLGEVQNTSAAKPEKSASYCLPKKTGCHLETAGNIMNEL